METKEEEKIKMMRKEIKTYYGIEYALVLVCLDSKKYADSYSPAPGEVDPDMWWNLEFTDSSEKIAKRAQRGFLWFDTRSWKDARMQDKYHQCEMTAILGINWLMGKYLWDRTKWLAREFHFFLYVAYKTMPQRIVFRIKQLIGRQA